jgi:hypothetical protein
MSSRPARLLRTALLVGLFAIPVPLAPAQDRAREARSVASFTEIEYGIPGTLHLRQGDDSSVEIDAPQKVLDKVETTVDGETLEITDGEDSGLFDQWFGGDGLDTDQIDVYVTASTLRHLTLAGSGRVVGESRVSSESLSLTVAGSGDMDLDLSAEELSVRVAGSGTCTPRGQTNTLEVNIAGSGDLRAGDLETQRAEVRIAGSGDAELNVADHLSAEIFGSGDVRYRGRPTVETSTFGSGEVRPLE